MAQLRLKKYTDVGSAALQGRAFYNAWEMTGG
jgi:hypothetical protein